MANCNCTDHSLSDYWLTELETVCDALGFVAYQVCEQGGQSAHLPALASTLQVLHSYLRIQLGTAPADARGEVRHG